MQDPDSQRPNGLDSLLKGRRLLFVIMMMCGLTSLGIGAIAAICQFAVPPIPHTPEFVAQFTVLEGFLFAGQAAKTAAYQAGCVALPFFLAFSFWIARKGALQLSDMAIDRWNRAGIALYLVLMVSCGIPLVYCPNPPFWIFPPSWILLPMTYSHPFCSPERLLCLLGAICLAIFFAMAPPTRQNLNRVLFALLALWLMIAPAHFYPPSEINDEPWYIYHFNSVADALSQSVNGHHMLVDFPHIYGGYVEILAPLIRLFPRDLGVFIVALGLPNIIGMLSLILTARLVIRQPLMLFLTGLTLLALCSLTSIQDVNYGYLTARLFMAPLALLAATFYFDAPSHPRYAVTTALAAVASIWNLDTGIVFFLSWVATLLAVSVAARDFRAALRHVIIQGVAIAVAWAAFIVYLRLASGQWPDLHWLFYFQALVVDAGYFCLRLIFPDMWVFILTLYIVGLVAALVNLVRGKAAGLTPVTLLLSLLGIGIFSYFMGRSAASNLLAVAYPAVFLAGIFCVKVENAMEKSEFPPETRFLLFPCRIALIYWTFLMVAGIPDLSVVTVRMVRSWMDPSETPLRANVAFIRQHVQPHENSVFFLSNHSGIYYYLSDTVRPIKLPGMIELLRTQDMNTLIDAIRAKRFNKLFVQDNFSSIQMYRADVYDEVFAAIKENYVASDTGPHGSVILYHPR